MKQILFTFCTALLIIGSLHGEETQPPQATPAQKAVPTQQQPSTTGPESCPTCPAPTGSDKKHLAHCPTCGQTRCNCAKESTISPMLEPRTKYPRRSVYED